VNLLTTLVLAAVVFLAWYFGVQAVNNTDTKGYHFGFIVLYCFQVCIRLSFIALGKAT
jgi:heme A synthase